MITVITGLFAGILHVVSGPDHLAALAPLAVKRPFRAWITGLRWGFGHTAGVGVIGLLSLCLREWLPLEMISGFSERAVGVLLIALGAWGIRKALQIHSHVHSHGDRVHEHIHMHAAKEIHAPNHLHMHAALGIGMLHGLAGSSHFLGILPALALPSNAQAAVYLASYCIGTIAGMTIFSCAVGAIAARSSARHWKTYQGLMLATSAAAIIMGGIWLAL